MNQEAGSRRFLKGGPNRNDSDGLFSEDLDRLVGKHRTIIIAQQRISFLVGSGPIGDLDVSPWHSEHSNKRKFKQAHLVRKITEPLAIAEMLLNAADKESAMSSNGARSSEYDADVVKRGSRVARGTGAVA